MHRLLTLIGAVVMLVSFPPGSARAAEATATVEVTMTVLPYVKLELTTDTVKVTLPEGALTATCDPAVVGGTVISNCAVSLFANVTPPAGAPGLWYVALATNRIDNPGICEYDNLFKIVVWNPPDWKFNNEEYNMEIASYVDIIAEEGVVLITAIPMI